MQVLRSTLAVAVMALASASLCSAPARACPFCDSNTAQQVRGGIFNSDFAYNLGFTLAPFVVLSAVLILILYWPSVPVRRMATGPMASLRDSSAPVKEEAS